MPTSLQTPIRRDDEAKQVGPKRYRKQILPIGKVPYDGKELDFSKAYLEKTAAAFNQGAYDQVPFQLADPENRHNADPEKFRGELTALELADDGLYGVLDLSDEGAKLIEANPKLGVSARIVQDHAKGPAIQHVLGTLDPVCTGMKAWEKLDLAKPTDGETLIDLSEADFEKASDGRDTNQDMSTDALKPEQVKSLAALADRLGGKDATDRDVLTDEDIAKLLGTTEDKEPETANLSKEAKDAIELAKKQAGDANDKADRLASDLALSNWKADRKDLALAGVPPSMLDLAEPHLSKASTVLELSNADSTASAMRKMLDEAKGTIDLSEIGRGAGSDDDSDVTEAKKFADDDEAWH